MNLNLNLKIKKRTQPEIFIYVILFLPFAFGFLTEFLPLPNVIKYIIDLAWLLSVVLIIKNYNRGVLNLDRRYRLIYLFPVAFFLVTLIVYIVHYQSAFYYLWGFRNNFRFYIAFYIFACFLHHSDIEEILKKIDILFWINAVVCLIQYFFLNKKHDNLGGLFGTEKGCNGFLNIFFVVIVVKSIIYFLNKRESIWLFIAKIATSLVLATFAELKFFYFEFIFIVLVAILVTNFSWRKFVVILSCVILVPIAFSLLLRIYPHFGEVFTSFDSIFDSATSGGYSAAEQVNRLTTIPIINEKFLDSTTDKFFGLGLGNCDTSNFAFLTTPFYEAYSYLRYNWFSTSFLYLETGIIGLVFVLGFYITVCCFALAEKKRMDKDKLYCQISAIVALCCILITVYNSSMRTEGAYIMYFFMALPFISCKEKIIT